MADASTLSEADLQQYDVAIVGELPLSDAQINMLSDWARAGGNLIAMRPGAQMLNAMGVGSPDSSVADSPIKGGAYIAIDGKSDAGAGLVHEPIQIHGPVDANLRCAGTSLATLYKDAKTATPFSPRFAARNSDEETWLHSAIAWRGRWCIRGRASVMVWPRARRNIADAYGRSALRRPGVRP